MKTLTRWIALRRIARIGQFHAMEHPGLCPDLDVAEPRDREIGIDLGVDPYLARDEWRRCVAAVSDDDLARRAFEAGFERGIPDPPPCAEESAAPKTGTASLSRLVWDTIFHLKVLSELLWNVDWDRYGEGAEDEIGLAEYTDRLRADLMAHPDLEKRW